MKPELMRELVTVEAFDLWLRWITIGGIFASVAGGLLWSCWKIHPKRWRLGILTGTLFAALFPLLYGLWRFYLWRIRIDLDRDFVGLHRVDVLVGNLLVFAVAGAIVGLIARFYINWLKRQIGNGVIEGK